MQITQRVAQFDRMIAQAACDHADADALEIAEVGETERWLCVNEACGAEFERVREEEWTL